MLEFFVQITAAVIWLVGVGTITLLSCKGAHAFWVDSQRTYDPTMVVNKQFDEIVRQ